MYFTFFHFQQVCFAVFAGINFRTFRYSYGHFVAARKMPRNLTHASERDISAHLLQPGPQMPSGSLTDWRDFVGLSDVNEEDGTRMLLQSLAEPRRARRRVLNVVLGVSVQRLLCRVRQKQFAFFL